MSHSRTNAFRFCLLLLSFVLSLNLLSVRQASAGSCVNWPKAMAQSEIARMPAEGKIVLVEPFTDFAKLSGDEWLVQGLRDYVADLLRTSGNLRVLAGQSAVHGGLSGSADFKVSGTFQHIGDRMRIFIRVLDARTGQLLAQPDASFVYPENQEFFFKTAEAVKTAMQVMKAEPDSTRFDAVKSATNSTRAYENFAKGRQALETCQADKVNVASMLFTEVKRIDYRSPLGYEGLIALYSFLALQKKSRGEGYSSEMQKAESEYVQMQKLTKPGNLVFAYIPKKPTRKDTGATKLDNRFLAGEAAYNESLAAAQSGDMKAAAEAMRRATQLVPEDALAWYQLSKIESNLGNAQGSQDALQKAYSYNSCVEK